MDDLTLGEMLTEGHRGQVDCFVQEGVSVSQSLSSGSMDQGNLMEKWSIDQGNLMSVTARKHRLGLYLKSKDRQLSRSVARVSHHELHGAHAEEERDPTRTIMATEIGIS